MNNTSTLILIGLTSLAIALAFSAVFIACSRRGMRKYWRREATHWRELERWGLNLGMNDQAERCGRQAARMEHGKPYDPDDQ